MKNQMRYMAIERLRAGFEKRLAVVMPGLVPVRQEKGYADTATESLWLGYLMAFGGGRVMRHYKGGMYSVICHAKPEVGAAHVVVYLSLDSGEIWTRPEAEFFGTVEHEGQIIPRFKDYN